MKRCLFYYTCLFLLAALHVTVFAAPNARSLSNGNLHFIENKGQVTDQHHNPRPDIHFKIPAANGLSIFIGAGKIHYQWTKHETTTPSSRPQWRDLTITEGDPSAPLRSAQGDGRVEMYRMDVTLLHANPHAEIITEQKQPYYERYYLPYTDEDGATAHTYRKITYREVYPHIDWVFYINAAGKAEHDFIVHPGGKVSDIRLLYAGATEMRLNDDGSVTAVTPFGSVTENTPYCYQQDGREVAAGFLLNGNTLSFSTAAYEGILTIDPVLEWGTYFGGLLNDVVNHIVCDTNGNIYMAGSTASTGNIATSGSHQNTYAGGTGTEAYVGDAFLAKFNRSGQLLWATYYGGTEGDQGMSVCLDNAGFVYLSGLTASPFGIATPGSHQDTLAGGNDAFLVQFDDSGQRQWATYYGGAAQESSATITGGMAGDVYLCGTTRSVSGIATPGSHQPAAGGGDDAFLARFDVTGQRRWGTYLGGSSGDAGYQAACGPWGGVYMAGYAQSTSGIATAVSHQPARGGGQDAFLARFDTSGAMQWATYYGGSTTDQGRSVACDPAGNVYLYGITRSTASVSTPGSHQPVFQGKDDAFLAKFDTAGIRLWGTYLGGAETETNAWGAIQVGIAGDIYLAGYSNSPAGIATSDGYQPQLSGSYDAYLVKFDSAGVQLWGSYYGGIDAEVTGGVAVDRKGTIYLAGSTNSGSGIATPGSHQPAFGSGYRDAFLVRFNDCDTPSAPGYITGDTFVCRRGSYVYTIPVVPGADSYTWKFPPGWSGNGNGDTITVMTGDSSGMITVAANNYCMTGQEQTLNVSVSPGAAILLPDTSLCAGNSVVLKANTGQGATWQWQHNDTSITGATDSLLHVSVYGIYRLITTNGQCSDTSEEVTVHAAPVPVITQNGTTLSVADHFAGYQWYFNSQLITGATQYTYTFSLPGDYSVTVTDTNGCTGFSDPYTPLRIIPLSFAADVQVYPNPTEGIIYIQADEEVYVAVVTMDGKEVWTRKGGGVCDLSALPDGVYCLLMTSRDGSKRRVEKIIKSNL